MLESTSEPAGAGTIGLTIRNISVTGSTVYSADDLRALLEAFEGRRTLSDVYAAAAALTKKYGDDGYLLSRVVVPPQELDPSGATVVLQVVEGFIDAVHWNGELSRYRDVFSGYERKITAERPLTIRTLERYLLLAGDLPGLNVTSTLKPSETVPGASTLVVDVAEKLAEGAIWIDNSGSEGRGPLRYRVEGGVGNLFGQHDSLSFTYGGAFETGELQYLTAKTSIVLNDEGTVFGATVSASGGAPGIPDLEAIAYESRSLGLSLDLTHPVIRSRETNLDVGITAFASNDSSKSLGELFSEDRLRGLRVSVNYSAADESAGVTEVFTRFRKGVDGFGSTGNDNAKASRDAGQVDFAKLELLLRRTQQLGPGWSAMLAASGQYAFTPLLAPEECSYGGEAFGRALDAGELSGDHCLSISAELRHDFDPQDSTLELAQAYAFADAGGIWRISPAAGTDASAAAATAGVGLRLNWDGGVRASGELSRVMWGDDLQGQWRARFALGLEY